MGKGSYEGIEIDWELLSAYDEMIKRLEPKQIIYFTRNSDNAPTDCITVVLPFRE